MSHKLLSVYFVLFGIFFTKICMQPGSLYTKIEALHSDQLCIIALSVWRMNSIKKKKHYRSTRNHKSSHRFYYIKNYTFYYVTPIV